MHQRGQLILHGCALRFGDQAAVLAGASGAGKSTLCAALHLRGHELLSDDLSVIDGQGLVQPGFPQIKIWADAARRLKIDTSPLTRIRLQVEKFAYPVREGFCAEPLPLAAVYILRSQNRDAIEFNPVLGLKKFTPLRNHTYRVGHIKGMGLQARHLQLCSRLANQVRMVHIQRPLEGFRLDELADRIEADMQPALVAAA
jgi:hypothetical protein